MREWVRQYLAEVDRIEAFFLAKRQQYNEEYETLKERYLRKQQDAINMTQIEDPSKQSLLYDSQLKLNNTQTEMSRDRNRSIAASKVFMGDESYTMKQVTSPSIAHDKKESRMLSSKSARVAKRTMHRVEAQNIASAKDELEYATNWRRALNKIFMHLKWLNAFAKINYIALLK